MLKECIELINYEHAECVEVHARTDGSIIFVKYPGCNPVHYCPVSPARLAVIQHANMRAGERKGAFTGPGIYHVTRAGALTFIPD